MFISICEKTNLRAAGVANGQEIMNELKEESDKEGTEITDEKQKVQAMPSSADLTNLLYIKL